MDRDTFTLKEELRYYISSYGARVLRFLIWLIIDAVEVLCESHPMTGLTAMSAILESISGRMRIHFSIRRRVLRI